MRVLHIVPNVPPLVGGVGDYAVRLAERLSQADQGLDQLFVCVGAVSQPTPGRLFHVVDFAGAFDRAARLNQLLAAGHNSTTAVFLHYVGYGYARRGAPIWLPRVLRGVLERQPAIRLFTMFHELYASGFPWRSSFWLAPAQRRVAAVLARLSDTVFTNRCASAAWLNEQGLRRPAVYSPTYSNVGEPQQPLSWGAREPVAAIFGGSSMRDRVYSLPDDALRGAFDRGGIDHVWDIGPPALRCRPCLAGRSVTPLGVLPPEEVSTRLGLVRLGVHPHPPAVLTKSGVAAAYFAHAVPLLAVDDRDAPAEHEGPPYLTKAGGDRAVCADIGERAFAWYCNHAHSRIAAHRVLSAMASAPSTDGLFQYDQPESVTS